jgi:hypothetical protein
MFVRPYKVGHAWVSSGSTSTESRTCNAFTSTSGESQTKASNGHRPAFSILFANNHQRRLTNSMIPGERELYAFG